MHSSCRTPGAGSWCGRGCGRQSRAACKIPLGAFRECSPAVGCACGEIPLPGREVCRLVSTVCLTRRRAPSEGAQLCVPQGPSETSKGDVPPLTCFFPDGCFYPCLNEES